MAAEVAAGRRIAKDLVGRVIVHSPSGSFSLGAGDEVPKGGVVDEGLLEPKAAKSSRSKGRGPNASSNN